MAYKIDVNGVIEETVVNNLQDMQSAVGGYIEPAGAVKYKGEDMTVLADEEGLLKDKNVNLWCLAYLGTTVVGDVLLVNESEFN